MTCELPQPSGTRLGSLGRAGTIAVAAGTGFGVSCAVATRDPVSSGELRLTERINDVPVSVAGLLYPVMQLGTLGGPIVVAAATGLARRDWRLSAATAIAGTVTWFGAKEVIGRGRPGAYLPEVVVREGDGTGLGYVSGHGAVAACAAVMAMAALPPAWHQAAASAALLVGAARVVHGVHLVADVVGGWSFGTLMGLAALGVLDLIERGGWLSAETG